MYGNENAMSRYPQTQVASSSKYVFLFMVMWLMAPLIWTGTDKAL